MKTIHRSIRILVLLLCCWLVAVAQAGKSPAAFSDETDAPSYDCRLTLRATAGIPAQHAVQLTLEAGGKSAAVLVRITTARAVITSDASHGHEVRYGETSLDIPAGDAYTLTVMRRADWLLLLHDDHLLLRCQAPRGGSQALLHGDAGWTVDDARVQRLEPVAFADDFMRTADNQNGQWTPRSGQWGLQSAWDADPHGNDNRFTYAAFAQKAFSWAGAATTGFALCTTGQPFWEDYTFSTALQPSAHGAAGVLVNMPDARSGLLVRWSPGDDHGEHGNRLALYHFDDGKQALLAESAGGYVPGQWYTLTVTCGWEGLRVAIDGRERLAITEPHPWRGGIGLYAEGERGAVFADVTVYGRTLNGDLLREMRQARITDRFQYDWEMHQWASRDEWQADEQQPNHLFSREEYFGDYWLTLIAYVSRATGGELWLGLHNDGQRVTTGYRAVVKRLNSRECTCVLYRDTRELARKAHVPLKADMDYTFRFRHQGERIWLECDSERLLEAVDATPVHGLHPAYAVSGCFTPQQVRVSGHNWLDYTFTDAPTDWIAAGAWMPSVRWACDPKWSFLGGWSRGDAILWHKQRFTGDQSLLAFVGPKMEYPRARESYDLRYRDFGVTICGNGQDARSGYTAIYGAADPDGRENRRTVLLREGVEVATIPVAAVTFLQGAHHRWFALHLRKKGDTVEFSVDNNLLLTYRDSHPLDGGVPAIWTTDNGIMLARARIDFANPPEPRTDPTVTLENPWYPEWADVNRPLALDFSRSWAGSGKPVQLTVTPRREPSGGSATPAVAGLRVTLTPRAIGDHWYQITAGDGEYRSGDFHLALPAFDPALGRDDAHAVVLYRFDEGQGAVVHDRSTVAPAVDLHIPTGADVRWLPGRGLSLRRQTLTTSDLGSRQSPAGQLSEIIASEGPVKKLLALAAHHAGAIEAWVSADTLCLPDDDAGCLVSWETAANQQNFALAHQFFAGAEFFSALMFAPHGVNLTAESGQQPVRMNGFGLGLNHVVVSWDGQQTVLYLNGVRLNRTVAAFHDRRGIRGGYNAGQRDVTLLPWQTEQWNPDARLLLGAVSNGQHYYLGAYYLLAIHDTALTDAQVRRHYLAGPDAK